MSKWHHRFLGLASHIAEWSKDRSTQVGAVVIGPKKEIRAVGYNGFPRGVDDEVESRHQRPANTPIPNTQNATPSIMPAIPAHLLMAASFM